jgi:osmotically inducible lipoprotein OsmB
VLVKTGVRRKNNMSKILKRTVMPLAMIGIVMLTACSNMNTTQQRALSGGAIGAGAGAVGTAITGGCISCGAVVGGAVGAGAGLIYDQMNK